MDSGSPVAGFLFLITGFVIYFLPTFVASNRKHVNGTSIFSRQSIPGLDVSRLGCCLGMGILSKHGKTIRKYRIRLYRIR